MSEFAQWDGHYEKDFYLALIDGKEVLCWPNAGEMCATDGSGRTWKPEDKIQVRIFRLEEHVSTGKSNKDQPTAKKGAA